MVVHLLCKQRVAGSTPAGGLRIYGMHVIDIMEGIILKILFAVVLFILVCLFVFLLIVDAIANNLCPGKHEFWRFALVVFDDGSYALWWKHTQPKCETKREKTLDGKPYTISRCAKYTKIL